MGAEPLPPEQQLDSFVQNIRHVPMDIQKPHEEDICTFFNTTGRSIRNAAGNALDHRLTNMPLETGELKSTFQGKNSVSWVSDKAASYIAGCHRN